MRLPTRLRTTTLGDLLGALHRASANGALELVDDRDAVHRVHVAAGLVAAVSVAGSCDTLGDRLRASRVVGDHVLQRSRLRALAARRLLGEVLVSDFGVSPIVVDGALREQIAARLDLLEQLPDARVLHREQVRLPRAALTDPLLPLEFLHGRRRARAAPREHAPGTAPSAAEPVRAGALRALGLQPLDAGDITCIKRAYRRIARDTHPDRHPAASEHERGALSARFAAATAAYRALLT